MRSIIGKVTGHEPEACPWHAFRDPLVQAVIGAYHACATESGCTPALLLPLDPQAEVFEGLVVFAEALGRARKDRLRREQQQREAEAKVRRAHE